MVAHLPIDCTAVQVKASFGSNRGFQFVPESFSRCKISSGSESEEKSSSYASLTGITREALGTVQRYKL